MAKLVYPEGGLSREYDLTGKKRVVIGRHRACDLRISDDSLSRQHAELTRLEHGEWELVDLQSANGIFVDGKRVSRAILRPGIVLRLGVVDLRFSNEPITGAVQKLTETSIAEELELEEDDLVDEDDEDDFVEQPRATGEFAPIHTGQQRPVTAPLASFEPQAGSAPQRPLTGPQRPLTSPLRPVTGAVDAIASPTRPVSGAQRSVASQPGIALSGAQPDAQAASGPLRPTTGALEPVLSPTQPAQRPPTGSHAATTGLSAAELVRQNEERAAQDARIRNLVQEVAALRQDLANAPSAERLQELEQLLGHASDERDRTIARMSTLAAELERWEAAGQKWQLERDRMRDALPKASDPLARLQDDLTRVSEELRVTYGEQELMRQELTTLQAQHSQLQQEQRLLHEDRARLQQELRYATEDRNTLQNENSRMLEELRVLREQASQQQDQARELAALQQRNAQMKTAFLDLRAELEALLEQRGER